jgi:hypothetical protein
MEGVWASGRRAKITVFRLPQVRRMSFRLPWVCRITLRARWLILARAISMLARRPEGC